MAAGVLRTKADFKLERDIASLISDLKPWAKEIRLHKVEIAARNFAIGMEVNGFLQTHDIDLIRKHAAMSKIAKGVGFTENYLRLVLKVSHWLYATKNVREIRGFMRDNRMSSWNRIICKYVSTKGKSRPNLSLRFRSAKTSLINLKEILPEEEAAVIDILLSRLNKVAERVF